MELCNSFPNLFEGQATPGVALNSSWAGMTSSISHFSSMAPYPASAIAVTGSGVSFTGAVTT